MTTPTREQVVQWAEDSGLKIGQHWNRSNMTTAFMLDFATLARADLEATIAEQAKELTDLRLQCITDFGQYQEAHEKIAEQVKEIDRLNYMITQMWSNEPEWINELRSLAKESVSLRQQLQASQAREAQMLAMILKQGLHLHPDKTKSDLKEKLNRLFPPDDTALREYGAKLVEKFFWATGGNGVTKYMEIQDKIREGTF